MHRSGRPCSWRRLWLWLLSAWLTPLSVAHIAQAQPKGPYAVVVVTKADESLPDLVRLAEAVDAELDRRQVPHIRLASARGLFETRHSREPMPASNEDVDLLLDAANKALAAAANADWKTALTQVRIALARGTGALETLNRNYKNAQHIFHACLLAVQGFAESGSDPEARRMAIECIARSPGLELPPDNRDYPPFVRSYLEEARETLDQAQTAPLVVTSAPSGCGVYVNGRKRGTTPYRQDNPARNPYLVQVECGDEQPGRVHTVTPGDETPPVHVDTKFENAVATDGGILRLRYPERDHAYTRDHLVKILKVLHADRGIAVTKPYPDRLALTRYEGHASKTVQLRKTFSLLELQDALTKLLAPSELSAEEAWEAADAPLPPPPQSDSERSPRLKRVLGASLSVLGGGAITSGWVLYHQRRLDGQSFRQTPPSDSAYLPRAQDWLDARVAPYVLNGAGSALLTAGASALALSAGTKRYPWWAPATLGAAGAALATWGIVDMVQGGPCEPNTAADRRSCVLDQERRDRGAMFLLNAFPLLATPAIQFALRGQSRSPPVSLTPHLGLTDWGLTVHATR